MAKQAHPKTTRKALEQGQLSKAALDGTQGYGDTALEHFTLFMQSKIRHDVMDRVQDAVLTRTIEGADTLEVTLLDADFSILRSGALARGLDVEIDGLWFRIQKVKLTGTKLTIVFEHRTVAILRTYARKMGPISRTKLTRAQFVERMLNEVVEFEIPYWIPELLDVQPVVEDETEAATMLPHQRGGGISPGAGTKNNTAGKDVNDRAKSSSNESLTSQGAPMNVYQIAVANAILRQGKSQGASRKVLVCSMMTAIQESNLQNLTDAQSPGTRSGVFQQDPRYWPASGNVVKDAEAFFSRAIGYDRERPSLAYHLLCEAVQGSGLPLEYAKRRTEAERIVTEFGVPGGDKEAKANATLPFGIAGWDVNASSGADTEYFFFRGKQPTSQSGWKPENSWDCIQRLAADVQWRAFFVGTLFMYVDEDELFKAATAAIVDHDTDGVDEINFDSDQNKQQANVDLDVWMKRWAAPPGSVIRLRNMGPANGKYLISSVTRSLFKQKGTIVLKKPWPSLPEPNENNLTNDPNDQIFGAKHPGSPAQQGVISDAHSRTQYTPDGRTPKQIIDQVVTFIARANGMVTGIDPAAIDSANARHGHTVNGTISDHEGPPTVAWAADMSNSGSQARDSSASTPEMDALARDLAATFGLDWNGEGAVRVTKEGYRYNMLYRTLIGGNHYNHVHFGVRRA